MAEADAAAAAAAGAGAPPAAPWYEGKADAEMVGFLQNKGWDKDPVAAAIGAATSYREAQRFVGAPPEQLIRLPTNAGDDAAWRAVHERLGVPKEAKEYDFAGVKFADGTDLEAGFTDTMRAALHNARVPKDRAGEVVKAVVKYLDDADASEKADFTTRLAGEKKALATNWGTTPEKLEAHGHMLHAKLGAQRLGVTPEEVAALENVVGYARVMDMFRKVGAGTSEDTFHEGKPGGATALTREAATARKAELMADKAWVKRMLDGGAGEVREIQQLDTIIANAA